MNYYEDPEEIKPTDTIRRRRINKKRKLRELRNLGVGDFLDGNFSDLFEDEDAGGFLVDV